MRRLVVLTFLLVTVRCQMVFFSSDLSGHYVPYHSNTTARDDCSFTTVKVSYLPTRMELEPEMDEEEEEGPSLKSYATDDCVGGVPRLVYQMETFRNDSDEDDSITASAGNFFGSDWELPIGYKAAAEAAKHFDVNGLGPGEFRRGTRFLRRYLQELKNMTGGNTDIVACNVQSSLLKGLVKPSVQKKKVFFVGFVDPEAVREFTDTDSDIQIGDLSCVQEEAQKAPGGVKTIAVGSASSLDQLKNFSSIFDKSKIKAVLLSGLPEEDKKALSLGRANFSFQVLFSDGYGASVGTFNITGNNVISKTLDSTLPSDITTLETIRHLKTTVDSFYDGDVKSFYDLRSDNCNSTECSIGDLICDAVVVGALWEGLHLDPPQHPERPIAVWPGVEVTGMIEKGNLSVSEVYKSDLPNTPVAMATASGDVVSALFARAVRDLTVDYGASSTFLQVGAARVTYDLDLAPEKRAKFLRNLCIPCSPTEYRPVSPSLNYTILFPATMLRVDDWADITGQFLSVRLAPFSARDAITALANATRFLRAPAGDRILFTHLDPDREPDGDTFVTALVTVVICMIVFGLAVLGFRAWSRRQQDGSTMGLLR